MARLELKWKGNIFPQLASEGCSSGWSGVKKRHLTEKKWAPYKEFILQLREEGKTLDAIQKAVVAEHGFFASVAQYKKVLLRWSPKNLNRAQRQFILHVCKQRGYVENDMSDSQSLPRFRISTQRTSNKEDDKKEDAEVQYIAAAKVQGVLRRYRTDQNFTSETTAVSPAGLSVVSSSTNTPRALDYDEPGHSDEIQYRGYEGGQMEPVTKRNKDDLEETHRSRPSDSPGSPYLGPPGLDIDFGAFASDEEYRTTIEASHPSSEPLETLPTLSETDLVAFAKDLLEKLVVPQVKIPDKSLAQVQPFGDWEKAFLAEDSPFHRKGGCYDFTSGEQNEHLVVETDVAPKRNDKLRNYLLPDDFPVKMDPGDDELLASIEEWKVEAKQCSGWWSDYKGALDLTDKILEALRKLGRGNRYSYLYWSLFKGMCLCVIGHDLKAIGILKEVFNQYDQTLGKLHRLTLASLDMLAGSLHRACRYSEAECSWKDLVQRVEQLPGWEKDCKLQSYWTRAKSCLAEVDELKEKFGDAEAIYTRLLRHATNRQGYCEFGQVRAMVNLARLSARRRGSTLTAKKYLFLAWAAAKEVRSTNERERKLELLSIWDVFGYVLQKEGQLKKALHVYQSIISPGYRDLFSPDHPMIIHSSMVIGTIFASLGWHDQALSYFTSAIPILLQTCGSFHKQTLRAVKELSIALEKRGMPTYAIPLMEFVVHGYEKTLGRDNENTQAAIIACGKMMMI